MKISVKSLLALLLALSLCLGLAACGGSGDAGKEPGETGDQPGDTGDQPGDTGDQPGDTGDQPGDTGDQPGDTGDQPDEGVSLIDMSIPEGTGLGDRIKDFTFTTYDGVEHNLYDTLKTKKMVLINCWATWCGPCQQEFPYMEAAYEANKDNVEVFAISCEPEDTDDVLKDYVSAMGMTFPVGRDVTDVYGDFSTGYIPISIVVDRFGVVCLVEVGSQDSSDTFQRLFDVFTGDDYTESVLLSGIPGPKPTVDAPDVQALSAALNTEGGALAVSNPVSEYDWPMKVMNKNDRTYLVSTNKGIANTSSLVSVTVEAKAGQVLLFDYRVSSEAGYDFLNFAVNGDTVKSLSGEIEWSTWAYEFTEDGTYEVTFAYVKDAATEEGSDLACVDEVRLVSAEEAAPYLAALPHYPHADADTISPADTAAREVVIYDPTGLVDANFGGARCYVVPGGNPSFNVTLTHDPDTATVLYFADGGQGAVTLADRLNGDVYTVQVPASTTSTYSYVQLYTDPNTAGPMVLYFTSEEALNTFMVRNLSNEDGTLAASWKYADGSAPGTTAILEGNDAIPEGSAMYTLVFADQNGDPVPGVIANVCDDDSCLPMTSDDNGVIGFVFPALAYHIQVIKAPDGYAFDTEAEYYTEANGGVLSFTLTKN